MQIRWWVIFMRLAGTAFLALVAYLVLNERSGQEISLIAGAFCFLMSLDAEKWKLGLTGVEAEMRKAVEEARASVAELHDMANLFANVTMTTMMSGTRFSGVSRREQREITEKIVGSLERIKLDPGLITEVKRIPYPINHYDHIQYVMAPAHKVMTQEQSKIWSDWIQPQNQAIGDEPDPYALEAFLVTHGLYTGEVIERMADYKQYHSDGTFRRPDVWENPKGPF